jgi:uncharacterized protein
MGEPESFAFVAHHCQQNVSGCTCVDLMWSTHVDYVEDEEHGITQLIRACIDGRSACVDFILAMRADANLADRDGHTPLHAASVFGHVDCVARLLQAGANVHVRDCQGATPLHAACMSMTPCAYECVPLLLNANSDPLLRCEGRTALMWAKQTMASESHQHVYEMLERASGLEELSPDTVQPV